MPSLFYIASSKNLTEWVGVMVVCGNKTREKRIIVNEETYLNYRFRKSLFDGTISVCVCNKNYNHDMELDCFQLHILLTRILVHPMVLCLWLHLLCHLFTDSVVKSSYKM